jgi:hypothetical protein
MKKTIIYFNKHYNLFFSSCSCLLSKKRREIGFVLRAI